MGHRREPTGATEAFVDLDLTREGFRTLLGQNVRCAEHLDRLVRASPRRPPMTM